MQILGVVLGVACAAATRSALELMYLQDVSSSFGVDPKALQTAVTGAFNALNSTYAFARFGVGTFADRPVLPFGSPGAFCYRIRYPLTLEAEPLAAAVESFAAVKSGGDAKECQLTALAEAAQPALNRWTIKGDTYASGEKIERIVVLVTDSDYHVEGDFVSGKFDSKGKLLKVPRQSYEPTEAMPATISVEALQAIADKLDQLDYPSVATVAKALKKEDITPVFIVTQNMVSVYQKLLKQLHMDGVVAVIKPDFSNLQSAIVQSVDHVIRANELFKYCDDDGFCDPPTAGPAAGEVVLHLNHVPKSIRYWTGEVSGFMENLASTKDVKMTRPMKSAKDVKTIAETEFHHSIPDDDFDETDLDEAEFDQTDPEAAFQNTIPEAEYHHSIPEAEFQQTVAEAEFQRTLAGAKQVTGKYEIDRSRGYKLYTEI